MDSRIASKPEQPLNNGRGASVAPLGRWYTEIGKRIKDLAIVNRLFTLSSVCFVYEVQQSKVSDSPFRTLGKVPFSVA